jgi:hypothetical protein
MIPLIFSGLETPNIAQRCVQNRKNSPISYPQRGPYGNNKFPGNTSGYLIRDLIRFYKAKSVLDPMEGSGTARDVCRELGVQYDGSDLSSGFDALTGSLPPKQYDLIFLHPPYWRMVRYSEDPRWEIHRPASPENWRDKLSFKGKGLQLLQRYT